MNGFDGVELTPRQRRLLWEMTTMIDVDTLNDNLARVHEEETGRFELDELASHLDRDGQYVQEWMHVEDTNPGTTE